MFVVSRRRPTDFTSCTSWINRVKFIIQNMQIVPCPTIDGSSFVQLDEKGYNHYFNPHKQGLASMLISQDPRVCWIVKFFRWILLSVSGYKNPPGNTISNYKRFLGTLCTKYTTKKPYTYLPYVPFNQPGALDICTNIFEKTHLRC